MKIAVRVKKNNLGIGAVIMDVPNDTDLTKKVSLPIPDPTSKLEVAHDFTIEGVVITPAQYAEYRALKKAAKEAKAQPIALTPAPVAAPAPKPKRTTFGWIRLICRIIFILMLLWFGLTIAGMVITGYRFR